MLDPNKPTDQELVSRWPYWVRQSRAKINTVVNAAGFGINNLDIAGGTTSLTVGTDLLAVGYEIVIVAGLGLATLATILGGTNGQIKTFVFQDNNIDLTDGIKDDGKFYLNQLPVFGDFQPEIDDVLTLVNIGGNGVVVHGYWKELSRQISVK